MTNLEVAIISGVTGALLTAIFSYKVQSALADRKAKADESRMAYAYLVKVSSATATKIAAVSIFEVLKKFFWDHIKDKISDYESEDGTFDLSHSLCVVIAREAQKTEKFEVDTSIEQSVSTIIDVCEKYDSDINLPLDVLSGLPRHAIVSYEFLKMYTIQIRGHLKMWEFILNKQDNSLITADFLYQQWVDLKKVFQYAEELRLALIVKGRIPKSEAVSLLKKQTDAINDMIRTSLFLKEKMKSVEQSIEKKTAEKK